MYQTQQLRVAAFFLFCQGCSPGPVRVMTPSEFSEGSYVYSDPSYARNWTSDAHVLSRPNRKKCVLKSRTWTMFRTRRSNQDYYHAC